MDSARLRTNNAYGGRAQEGVLEVFMLFMRVIGLKMKTLVITVTECMIVEQLE